MHCMSNSGRASRASFLSPVLLSIVFERQLLTMHPAEALYSLMSFNELGSTCEYVLQTSRITVPAF